MSKMSSFLTISVVFLYLGYLVLPGYIALCFAKIRRNRFLLGYGISFSLLVITQIPIRVFGGSPALWFWVVHIAIATLLVTSWLYGRSRSIPPVFKKGRTRRRTQYAGFIAVLIGFSIYHLSVGAYTEIPSDFWVHLGDTWNELININKGVLPGNGLDIAEIINGNYASFLHAVAANLLQSNPLWLVPGATLSTSIIFLGATYWFTFRIISTVRLSRESKIAIATLTTILTVLSFGVSTFSYVRYYAYFHSILNFPLIYLSLLLLIDYLERPQGNAIRLLPIPVFLLTMGIVHKQEALFTLVLLFGVAIWRMIRTFQFSRSIPKSLWRRTRILGLSAVTILPLVLIYTFLKLNMVIPESGDLLGLPRGIWLFQRDVFQKIVVIDLGHIVPFLKGLPITNPGLRFWNVLAPFGVVVYLWYFSRRRWFAGIDYINVGMVSPLLTLFNPIFVIWFLHLMTADVLWRMSYLMPLSLVAAFLIVYSFADAYKASDRWKLLTPILVTLVLVVSLLPLAPGLSFFENRIRFIDLKNNNSRLPSLYSIHETNGAGLWEDLIRAVEKISGNRVILADGVTRYVLSNATPHRQGVGGKELWRSELAPDFLDRPHKGDPKKNLRAYQQGGDLLVINKRDGAHSDTGSISGHWPEDILSISKYYPIELVEYASEDGRGSKYFQTGFSGDRIWIYEIR